MLSGGVSVRLRGEKIVDATAGGKTRFKCGQCGQVLSASTTAAGKVVACPCGQKLRVPGAATPQEVEVLDAVLIDDHPVSTPAQMQSFDAMHSAPAAPAGQSARFQDDAQEFRAKCAACGVTLRIPAKNAGKKIKCKCGHVFQHSVAAQVVSVVADQNVGATPLSGQQATQAVQQDAGLFDDAFANVEQSAMGAGQVPARQFSQSSSQMKRYRKPEPAASRTSPNKAVQNEKSKGSLFDGGILGGVGMIVGALVWLVVGLYNGWLFYYPLFMLIVGAGMIIKGAVEAASR